LWLLSSGEGRRSVACSARRKVGKGDVVRVYTASKAKHAQWWRALRAAGIDIVSTWIDWDGNLSGSIPTADAWARHWCRCIDEARDCDILLFVNGEAEQACGALVELGAALAAGKRVFLVSPHWWSFQHHPACALLRDACRCSECACGYSRRRAAALSESESPARRVIATGGLSGTPRGFLGECEEGLGQKNT